MSIVNGTGGNFTYSNLGLAGWLCASSQPSTCNNACPNNSSAEGQQFYLQFTSSSQAVQYRLTGIAQCNGAEGIVDGQDPDKCTVGLNCPAGCRRLKPTSKHSASIPLRTS
jgi:hypothetical protein